MQTTLFLPEAAEGLLAETHEFVLLDGRIGEILVGHARKLPGRPYNAAQETPNTYACRAWRHLLPGDEAGDAQVFRMTYGWTPDELDQIVDLLQHVRDELVRLSEDVLLSGTQATLLRDAERVGRLISLWSA